MFRSIFMKVPNSIFLFFVVTGLLPCLVNAQSVEIMVGTENLFTDVQWLKNFEANQKVSVFSRSRATDDYQNHVYLFTGAYLNYTTANGFGGTLVGRMASSGSGADAGIHFFKVNRTLMVYALASVTAVNGSGASWFSITRFTPGLSQSLNGYFSLELFSNFSFQEHQFSTQRLRAGLEKGMVQFGLALNISQAGSSFISTETNPGIFLRTVF